MHSVSHIITKYTIYDYKYLVLLQERSCALQQSNKLNHLSFSLSHYSSIIQKYPQHRQTDYRTLQSNSLETHTAMSFLKTSHLKTYCFNHLNNIMFFQYNSNHPILMKNLKFELGKIKIFCTNGKLYSCTITSNPHLNVVLQWNEEYFAKLFHGLAFFELEESGDEDDDTLSLVVRDRFEQNEQIFLMRAKLNQQFGYDLTTQLWNTFAKFNLQKQKTIQTMLQDNIQYRRKADQELTLLIQLQQKKQQQKIKLKGQLSALLRQKEAKLREYNEMFEYHNFYKESEPSVDLSEQKESMSIAGSLFQESQDFNYYRA